MDRKNIILELITNMFSAGADGHTAEFRITELKALMRSTFREFFEYTNLEDLNEKEAILFGSTKRKSPVMMRMTGGNIRRNIEEKLVLHKENIKKIPALLSGTEINIVFECRNIKFLELYIDILKLAAITGGLGKRSRKGMGSFKIKSIDGEIISTNCFENLKELSEERKFETTDSKGFKKTYAFKIRKFSIDKLKKDSYVKYIIECNNMPNIHYAKYLHKIKIENENIMNILKNISELTHKRLEDCEGFISKETNFKLKEENLNKEVLGNFKGGKLLRFASPVYVTLHEEGNDPYIIIKELNYKYIYEHEQIKEKELDLDSKYIAGYINEILQCCGGKR
ncbi:type III-B CRISPR module RAMP protein Cmr1 [Desnuesiella massiliensis]|uniref:type III-B CRISPR module RAMP protein Cmr1 n=1 Tax=Desnuesiella massiliensis TaxID=1650662 RepID=UPI0006E469C4|nr:type III-B CRISPR module RAMP protein Cmr1 [Desnuesiella massiliensis]